jgi:hypothetical protein
LATSAFLALGAGVIAVAVADSAAAQDVHAGEAPLAAVAAASQTDVGDDVTQSALPSNAGSAGDPAVPGPSRSGQLTVGDAGSVEDESGEGSTPPAKPQTTPVATPPAPTRLQTAPVTPAPAVPAAPAPAPAPVPAPGEPSSRPGNGAHTPVAQPVHLADDDTVVCAEGRDASAHQGHDGRVDRLLAAGRITLAKVLASPTWAHEREHITCGYTGPESQSPVPSQPDPNSTPGTGSSPDTGARPDPGSKPDTDSKLDAGAKPGSGSKPDTGSMPDTGDKPDAPTGGAHAPATDLPFPLPATDVPGTATPAGTSKGEDDTAADGRPVKHAAGQSDVDQGAPVKGVVPVGPAKDDLISPVAAKALVSEGKTHEPPKAAVPTSALCVGSADIGIAVASVVDREAPDTYSRPRSAPVEAASTEQRVEAAPQAIAPVPDQTPAPAPLSPTAPMPAPAPAAPFSGGACPTSSSAGSGTGGPGGAHNLPWAVHTSALALNAADAPGAVLLDSSAPVIGRAVVPGSSPG